MPRYVMVLNDGETYTDVAGCAILRLPADLDEGGVDEFVKSGHGIQDVLAQFTATKGSDGIDVLTWKPRWSDTLRLVRTWDY